MMRLALGLLGACAAISIAALVPAPGVSGNPPGEVTDLRLTHQSGETTLDWTPPADPGCLEQPLTYDVLWSPFANDFVGELRCAEVGTTATSTTDLNAPLPDRANYFLVRAQSCASGGAGTTSAGTPRAIGAFDAVENMNDSGAGSLRQAIADAAPGALVCVPLSGALALTSGALVVQGPIHIRGPGRDLLRIDAGGAGHPVFDIDAVATLSDLTISNADPGVSVSAAGVLSLGFARVANNQHGIYSFGGPVSVSFSEIAANSAAGVFADSSEVTIEGSEVRDNGDEGVRALISGQATIRSSVIRDNGEDGVWATVAQIESSAIQGNGEDGVDAGFVQIESSLIRTNERYGVVTPWGTIEASTIDSNLSSGIYVEDDNQFTDVVITTTTISGHTNGSGTGVYVQYYSEAVFRSSTLFGNSLGLSAYDADVTVLNTIVAGNFDQDCFIDLGAFQSQGYNLASDLTCEFDGPRDQTGLDPQLGPLQLNGGPTPTHLPAPGSPVLDAGSCPTDVVDQRGVSRPIDLPSVVNAVDGCDIGAVERKPNE